MKSIRPKVHFEKIEPIDHRICGTVRHKEDEHNGVLSEEYGKHYFLCALLSLHRIHLKYSGIGLALHIPLKILI